MIVERNRSWLSLLLRWQGSILPRIWRRLLVVITVSLVVTGIYVFGATEEVPLLTVVPFSLVGLALSIFLGFRNSTSYDRFWEGRKLWGRFVNTSRSMGRQVLTLMHTEELAEQDELAALQHRLIKALVGYVHAVRLHLRDQNDQLSAELALFLTEDDLVALEGSANPPVLLLQRIGVELATARQRGWIDRFHATVLEASLTELTEIQGGCERIKNTPIPYTYTVLIHRIVAVYCFALPFGIVPDVKLFTPLVAAMVSYAFFGLDAIGDEIEEPFGEDVNDLPLGALCRMIEVNLYQSLGLPHRPLLQPSAEKVLN